jgi:pantothenate kinase
MKELGSFRSCFVIVLIAVSNHLSSTVAFALQTVRQQTFRQRLFLQQLKMVSVDENMNDTYLKLTNHILNLSIEEGRQYWICLAGGPGAGKSTLSSAVVELVNRVKGSDYCVVLPMDGFHYSRKQLKDMSEIKDSPSFDELLSRRGSHWTFDAVGIIAALSEARSSGSGSLPTYSRAISDPVPGGVELLKSHKVVIVEGNYMLDYDNPLWAPLQALFNEKWYISCSSMDKQRKRLMKRHLETWTPEKARMWGQGEVGKYIRFYKKEFNALHFMNYNVLQLFTLILIYKNKCLFV